MVLKEYGYIKMIVVKWENIIGGCCLKKWGEFGWFYNFNICIL